MLLDMFSFGSRSQAIPDAGQLYLFGQNKKTGEANMYPKPVQDLAGNRRFNTSLFVTNFSYSLRLERD